MLSGGTGSWPSSQETFPATAGAGHSIASTTSASSTARESSRRAPSVAATRGAERWTDVGRVSYRAVLRRRSLALSPRAAAAIMSDGPDVKP